MGGQGNGPSNGYHVSSDPDGPDAGGIDTADTEDQEGTGENRAGKSPITKADVGRFLLGSLHSLLACLVGAFLAIATIVYIMPLFIPCASIRDGAMAPDIPAGSLCILEKRNIWEVELGENVAYVIDGKGHVRPSSGFDGEGLVIADTDSSFHIGMAEYRGVVVFAIPLLGYLR